MPFDLSHLPVANRLETKVAGVTIDALGRRWDPSKHPRDNKGRFIETGGVARIWGGGVGKVLRTLVGGKVELRTSDGKTRVVPHERLTMLRRPDGSAPTKNVRKVAQEDARRESNPKRGDGKITADDHDGDGIPDYLETLDFPDDEDEAQREAERLARDGAADDDEDDDVEVPEAYTPSRENAKEGDFLAIVAPDKNGDPKYLIGTVHETDGEGTATRVRLPGERGQIVDLDDPKVPGRREDDTVIPREDIQDPAALFSELSDDGVRPSVLDSDLATDLVEGHAHTRKRSKARPFTAQDSPEDISLAPHGKDGEVEFDGANVGKIKKNAGGKFDVFDADGNRLGESASWDRGREKLARHLSKPPAGKKPAATRKPKAATPEGEAPSAPEAPKTAGVGVRTGKRSNAKPRLKAPTGQPSRNKTLSKVNTNDGIGTGLRSESGNLVAIKQASGWAVYRHTDKDPKDNPNQTIQADGRNYEYVGDTATLPEFRETWVGGREDYSGEKPALSPEDQARQDEARQHAIDVANRDAAMRAERDREGGAPAAAPAAPPAQDATPDDGALFDVPETPATRPAVDSRAVTTSYVNEGGLFVGSDDRIHRVKDKRDNGNGSTTLVSEDGSTHEFYDTVPVPTEAAVREQGITKPAAAPEAPSDEPDLLAPLHDEANRDLVQTPDDVPSTPEDADVQVRDMDEAALAKLVGLTSPKYAALRDAAQRERDRREAEAVRDALDAPERHTETPDTTYPESEGATPDEQQPLRDAGPEVLDDVPAGGDSEPGEPREPLRAPRSGDAGQGGRPGPADRGQSAGDGRRDGADRPAEGSGPAGRGSGAPGDDLPAEGAGDRAPRNVEAPAAAAGDDFQAQSQADLAQSGFKTRFRNNLEALRTLRAIEADGRTKATKDEQRKLARWSGWGALAPVLDGGDTRYDTEREQLREVLPSDSEWNAARKNALNAHYTDLDLVKATWEGMQDLGFDGGNVLEPGSGSGNFIGTAPKGTRMTGVELEPNTAKISQLLYPSATVRNEGFENTRVGEDTFDAAVGNVPFGDLAFYDPEHNPDGFSIHNAFIQKAINATKPGGLVAVHTSRFTMDGNKPKNRRARESFYEKADLVGAVRLPEGAHSKTAGTDVVTDLLIFRKRKPGEQPGDDSWLKSSEYGDTGLPMNDYFQAHPENVLGEVQVEQGGMYGPDQTLTVKGDKDRAGAQLREALGGIAEQARDAGMTYAPEVEQAPQTSGNTKVGGGGRRGKKPARGVLEPVAAPDTLGEGVIKESDTVHERTITHGQNGKPLKKPRVERTKFTQVVGGVEEPYYVPSTQEDELRHLIGLRNTFELLKQAEEQSTEDNDKIRGLRQDLNDRYDAYTEKFGPIGRYKLAETPDEPDAADEGDEDEAKEEKPPRRIYPPQAGVRFNPAFASVFALDSGYDPETDTALKASVFEKRTVAKREVPTKADSIEDAVALVQEHVGRLDVEAVAKMLGSSRAKVVSDLARKGLAFRDPEDGQIVSRAEYLSGHVRSKLRKAQEAAASDPSMQANVEALQSVVPEDKTPANIMVTLGAPWIKAEYVQQFADEMMGHGSSVTVENPGGSMWTVRGTGRNSVRASQTWGTARKPFHSLLEAMLSQAEVKVYDEIDKPDGGTKRVLNADATLAAQDKAEEIADRFAEWVWENPKRAADLLETYNDRYNSVVGRSYDNSPKRTFPGMAPDWQAQFMQHQTDAVTRAINEPAALFAHVVGAGKTAEMTATSMELRRLGMAKKPAFVVPNHMLAQWHKEYLEIYPQAKILAVDSSVLGSADKRRVFLSRVRNGDWDAVIFTQESFKSIPLKPENERRYLEQEIEQLRRWLENANQAARESGNRKSQSVKQIEKQIANAEARIKRLMDAKKDRGALTFEETGIDYLMVDEAHHYKNLRTPSSDQSLSKVGSQKATDLDMKLWHLRGTNNTGRVVTFATGTPIANSISEAYVMQKFLRPDLLEQAGIEDFDSWVASFAEKQTVVEMTVAGKFRQRTRFSKFRNLSGLLRMWSVPTDTRLAEDLTYLKRPDLKPNQDGERLPGIEAVPASEAQAAYIEWLGERAERVENGMVTPEEDNLLKIASDGRKAAFDLRLVNDEEFEARYGIDLKSVDGAGSKITQAAQNIGRIYEQNRDRKYGYTAKDKREHPNPGGLQIVFADLGTPKDKDDGRFSTYDELKRQLVENHGIPASKIRYIHEANTAQEKQALFDAANKGEISVLIGSTEKMGVGTNVQNRALALHHLDVPWRPADLEQREGRVIRQGNQNEEVEVLRYVTEGTFDAFMWGAVERKAGFIQQMMRGDMDQDEIEDVSDVAADAAMVKSIASGNPLLVDQAFITGELRKLRKLSNQHKRNQDYAKRLIAEGDKQIERAEHNKTRFQQAIDRRMSVEGDDFQITLSDLYGRPGAPIKDKKDAIERLRTVLKERHDGYMPAGDGYDQQLGRFGGLSLLVRTRNMQGAKKQLVLSLSESDSRYDAQPLPNTEVIVGDSALSSKDGVNGVLTQLTNRLNGLDDQIGAQDRRIAAIRNEQADAGEELKKDFARADELDLLEKRSKTLNEVLEKWDATADSDQAQERDLARQQYEAATQQFDSLAASKKPKPHKVDKAAVRQAQEDVKKGEKPTEVDGVPVTLTPEEVESDFEALDLPQPVLPGDPDGLPESEDDELDLPDADETPAEAPKAPAAAADAPEVDDEPADFSLDDLDEGDDDETITVTPEDLDAIESDDSRDFAPDPWHEDEGTDDAAAEADEPADDTITVPSDAVFDRFPDEGQKVTLADGRTVTFDADTFAGIEARDEDGNRITLTDDELMGWRPWKEPTDEAIDGLDVPEASPAAAGRPKRDRKPRGPQSETGDGTTQDGIAFTDTHTDPEQATIGDAIAETEAEQGDAEAPDAEKVRRAQEANDLLGDAATEAIVGEGGLSGAKPEDLDRLIAEADRVRENGGEPDTEPQDGPDADVIPFPGNRGGEPPADTPETAEAADEPEPGTRRTVLDSLSASNHAFMQREVQKLTEDDDPAVADAAQAFLNNEAMSTEQVRSLRDRLNALSGEETRVGNKRRAGMYRAAAEGLTDVLRDRRMKEREQRDAEAEATQEAPAAAGRTEFDRRGIGSVDVRKGDHVLTHNGRRVEVEKAKLVRYKGTDAVEITGTEVGTGEPVTFIAPATIDGNQPNPLRLMSRLNDAEPGFLDRDQGLTPEQDAQIREAYLSGTDREEVADQFGIPGPEVDLATRRDLDRQAAELQAEFDARDAEGDAPEADADEAEADLPPMTPEQEREAIETARDDAEQEALDSGATPAEAREAGDQAAADEATDDADVAEEREIPPAPQNEAQAHEPKTPTQLDSEKYPLTPQQQMVADAVVADRQDVKVEAKAGAGKTSTLEAIARRFQEADPNTQIAYIAFNKSVQVEAEGRMPGNTEPRTGHSIAFAWRGRDWTKRKFKNPDALRRADEIADHLGIRGDLGELEPAQQAQIVMRAVGKYSNSADDDLDLKHFDGISDLKPAEQQKLLAYGKKAWADLNALDGRINVNNDHIRKMWALSRPDLSKRGSGLRKPASVLFLDEAQDTPPVLAKVVADQNMQKVIVGDADQAIYGFTGATDYLSTADADVALPLTKSWRFGPEVADIGNRFLQVLGSKDRVEGGGPSSEIVHDMRDADAILVRSNGGMIQEILREQEAGRKVGVPKGTKKDLLALVESARYLKGEGRAPSMMHEDLAPFRSWEEFEKAATDERNPDPKLAMLHRIISAHGIDGLERIIRDVEELTDGSDGDGKDESLKGAKVEQRDNEVLLTNAFNLNKYLTEDTGRGLRNRGWRFNKHGNKEWSYAGDEADQMVALDALRGALGTPFGGGASKPDVIVSTAHKAKGLEWERVRIGDDFRGPETDDAGKTHMPEPEELKLAYVAVTRAEKELDPGSLGWVYDYSDPNGDESRKADAPDADTDTITVAREDLPTVDADEADVPEGAPEADADQADAPEGDVDEAPEHAADRVDTEDDDEQPTDEDDEEERRRRRRRHHNWLNNLGKPDNEADGGGFGGLPLAGLPIPMGPSEPLNFGDGDGARGGDAGDGDTAADDTLTVAPEDMPSVVDEPSGVDPAAVKGTPEYRAAYERGWKAGANIGALDRADERGEPSAWYDGYHDRAADRPKWTLMHHESVEAYEAAEREAAEAAGALSGDEVTIEPDGRWNVPTMQAFSDSNLKGKAPLARSLYAAADATDDMGDSAALTMAGRALTSPEWNTYGGPEAQGREAAQLDQSILDQAGMTREGLDSRVRAVRDLADYLDNTRQGNITLGDVRVAKSGGEEPRVADYLRSYADAYFAERDANPIDVPRDDAAGDTVTIPADELPTVDDETPAEAIAPSADADGPGNAGVPQAAESEGSRNVNAAPHPAVVEKANRYADIARNRGLDVEVTETEIGGKPAIQIVATERNGGWLQIIVSPGSKDGQTRTFAQQAFLPGEDPRNVRVGDVASRLSEMRPVERDETPDVDAPEAPAADTTPDTDAPEADTPQIGEPGGFGQAVADEFDRVQDLNASDEDDPRPATLPNGNLPNSGGMVFDTATDGTYSPDQIDYLAEYGQQVGINVGDDWHIGHFRPSEDGKFVFDPITNEPGDDPIRFSPEDLHEVRGIRAAEMPGVETDPADLRPGTRVAFRNRGRLNVGVLENVTPNGRAQVRDANGSVHESNIGQKVRPIIGAYLTDADVPQERAFAPVAGVWQATDNGGVATASPGEWVAGIAPDGNGGYRWEVSGVPGSGVQSRSGTADSIEDAKAKVEDALWLAAADRNQGDVSMLPADSEDERDAKQRELADVTAEVRDATGEATSGPDEGAEDETATAPTVDGQPAAWVPTGELQPGDIAHVEGDNGNGSATTRTGHVLGTPESVEVHTPGINVPEKGWRVTLGDTRDGQGDRGSVLSPDGDVSARATRDEDAGDRDNPASAAESDVLSGRMGESVPTDRNGLGIFPGSVVVNTNGREGVVSEATARDVAVRWAGDDKDTRHGAGTLAVHPTKQNRPDGWTSTGQQVKPGRHIVETPAGHRGVVESVEGDTVEVVTPDGIEHVGAADLKIVGQVADEAEAPERDARFDAPTSPEGLDVRPTAPVKPEALPDGVTGSAVNLKPEQRVAFEDLGLDTDATSLFDVQQAAARIRHRMPISADQARALSEQLDAMINSDGMPKSKARMLKRIQNRVDAAGVRAGGTDEPTAPEPEAAAAETLLVGAVLPGDVIAVPPAGGGEARPAIVVAKGPAVVREDGTTNPTASDITVEYQDGTQETLTMLNDAEVFRLPDAPHGDDEAAIAEHSDRPFTEPRVNDRLHDAADAVTDKIVGDEPDESLADLGERVHDTLDSHADANDQRNAGRRLDTALGNSGVDQETADTTADAADAMADEVREQVADTARNTVEDAEPLPGESDKEAAARVRERLRDAAGDVDYDEAAQAALDAADRHALPGRPTPAQQARARREVGNAMQADLMEFADRLAELGDTEAAGRLAELAAQLAANPNDAHVQAAVAAAAMGQEPGRVRSLTSRVRAMFARARRRFLDRVKALMGTGRKAKRSFKAAIRAARAEWNNDRDVDSLIGDASKHLARGGDADEVATARPDGSFADQVAYWKGLLPETGIAFGHKETRGPVFRGLTLDALRSGRQIRAEDSVGYRLDRNSDGGPGDTAQTHLNALTGLGATVRDEVDARVRTRLPDLGHDPAGAVREAHRYADEVARDERGELSDAELAKLRKKARREADDLAHRYADAQAEAIMEVLGAQRSMGPKGAARLNIQARSQKADEVKALRWAEQHLPTDWLAAAGTVEAQAGRMGSYDGDGTITVAPLGDAARTGAGEYGASALHGLAHHLETVMPQLRTAQWAYHWNRSSDSMGRRRGRNGLGWVYNLFPGLNGHKGDGTARAGDFPTAWMGVEDGDHREVLALGLEALFAGAEANADDDLKAFMLGLLAWMERNG